jgi:hypothetical protein
MLKAINDFLDQHVLPWPVRFLTFRFVILATIGLLIPLLVYANNQVLVLSINSYLNTMSVAVSSIVLLYATLNEAHQKQIAEMQEKRAQEDHAHVTEMHTLVLQALNNQHEEIEDLKEVVAALRGQAYERPAAAALPDLRELHTRGGARFEAHDVRERLAGHLHRHPLAENLRRDLAVTPPS